MSGLFHQQTPVSFGFSSFQEATAVMSCSLPSFNSVGLRSQPLSVFFFLIYFADWLLAFPSPSCSWTFYIWSRGCCLLPLQLHKELQRWLHFRAENNKHCLLWLSGDSPQLDHQSQKQRWNMECVCASSGLHKRQHMCVDYEFKWETVHRLLNEKNTYILQVNLCPAKHLCPPLCLKCY